MIDLIIKWGEKEEYFFPNDKKTQLNLRLFIYHLYYIGKYDHADQLNSKIKIQKKQRSFSDSADHSFNIINRNNINNNNNDFFTHFEFVFLFFLNYLF